MTQRQARLPEGLEDQLPARCEQMEEVGARLGSLLAGWGYRRVEPPLVEGAETFAADGGGSGDDQLYKLLDSDGRLLALRPDMTAGVARLIAQALGRGLTRNSPGGEGSQSCFPLRLRYEGTVFRRLARGSGHAHCLRQIGVELIGSSALDADAEVMALAYEAARAAGLADLRLVVGHAGLVRGIAAGVRAPEGAGERWFREALERRDMVALEQAAGPGLAELLVAGPHNPLEARRILTGLADSSSEARQAAQDLLDLEELLKAYGIGQPWLDLALLRDLDYYSGVVFEVLSPVARGPVAGGGRYDGLLERFGSSAPATGFALDLTATTAAHAASKSPGAEGGRRRNAIAWAIGGAGRGAALAMAQSLRRQGEIAEILAGIPSLSAAIRLATNQSADRLLYLDGTGYREIRLGQSPVDTGLSVQAAAALGIH